MRPVRHSKFKNTGIIFELLARQITADMMSEQEKSPAVGLIKKYFKKGTELNKELHLYKLMLRETFKKESDANEYIHSIITTRKSLNETKLRREKFNLIRDITIKYDAESFFKSKINNYTEFASIYKLFEYDIKENPGDLIKCKSTLVEYICSDKSEVVPIKTEYESLDSDVRRLSYKFLVEKFNRKYSVLLNEQKELLRVYINSVDDNIVVKEHIQNTIPKLRKSIESKISNISEKVTKIKVNEVLNILENIENVKRIQEKHVLNLLRFYELDNELNSI